MVYNKQTDPTRELIDSDVAEMNRRLGFDRKLYYYVVRQPAYRTLFYYRVGFQKGVLKFLFPGMRDFYIQAESIGKNCFVLNHPYATILNANTIGDNFTCCQLTTIGNKIHGRNDLVPTIGNNVSLGANVTIIGDITIGNNVQIGAGSVVVKNIPSDCVVVGNPARIIPRNEHTS